jgi:hypothetical protein
MISRVSRSLFVSQSRGFGYRPTVASRKEWYDTTHAGVAKKQSYIRPGDVKKTETLKLEREGKEDFKNLLLEARVMKPEVVVEEDKIFGFDLPQELPLNKKNNKEMYYSDKPVDFQYLIALYSLM